MLEHVKYSEKTATNEKKEIDIYWLIIVSPSKYLQVGNV